MDIPHLHFESLLWKSGILNIAGIDEAGRGAWAGPVAAGAVILPPNETVLQSLSGVRDSKQMSAHQRTIWAERIKEIALAWQVGFCSNLEIDEIGILPATKLAMERALTGLNHQIDFLLIDALLLRENEIPQINLIKGDARSLSIAAASVLAKSTRDALMEDFDQQYEGYQFAKHKGYGTKLHQKNLEKHGPSSLHRVTYAPIARLLNH
jgi:ribonuclease HII